MKTRILVNRHIIAKNRKTGTRDHPIAIKQGKETFYVSEVPLENAVLVYRPDKPLNCGATVWIEADMPKRGTTVTINFWHNHAPTK